MHNHNILFPLVPSTTDDKSQSERTSETEVVPTTPQKNKSLVAI